jgi:hypothetical protein
VEQQAHLIILLNGWEIIEIIKISMGKEKLTELPLSQSLKASLLTKHGYQNRHKINGLMMHF